MKYKHATWRKLYVDEEGAFARLPFTARSYAKQLILLCDDAGRIDVGDASDPVKALVDTAAFRMGATRGDRRMMSMMFPLLFAEGFLQHRGRHIVLRNFVAAQRRWDSDEEILPTGTDDEVATNRPRPSNEPTTTEQRSHHEAATTEQRPSNEAATKRERSGNEAATKTELSARKHDDENASARARAHSSVPSSLVPFSFELQTPDPTTATKKGRREPKLPEPDREPEAGTPAARLRDIIVADPVLGPSTRRPGDFAIRATDGNPYPGVDVVAQAARCAEWCSRGKRVVKDGRATLSSWLARAAEDVRTQGVASPKPATWQDRPARVVAAPVPESFEDTDPDPLNEIVRARAERTQHEMAKAVGGTK